MGTLLVAVGLLCLCGVSMSYDSYRQALLRDVDFPGSDIKHVTSPDAEHCQLLCTQHPTCRFFTFLRPDWTRDNRQFFCYLKASPSGQPRVQNALHGHTSGFSLKPCNPDPKPCLHGVYHHVDFPGADFRTLFTANYEECQRECTHDPACQFFTFIKGNYRDERTRYKCYLKFSWTVPRTLTVLVKAGIVSGFSHNLPINSGHYTTGNLTLLPKVVLIGATTSAGCCHACFLIGLLVLYSIRLCYHKRVIILPAPSRVIKLANVVSGFSLKNCP
ncbi:coagulation factor XI-like [Epinephelus moara]|uniref:coagulation factor XI-like n=1 Tax=Epinephelus moara TaxID=300413 RepID=UPI00214F0304|nr:coagulation factor XI-like [Epinephelus moara]